MKTDTPPDDDAALRSALAAHGLTEAVRLALEVLAPAAPLAAGLLRVVQPLAGGRAWVGHLAAHLEDAAGVARLRQLLDEDTGAP
ncbi:MAG: hypothetical protein MUE40_19010 [Anaerolineae bacterium]|jgi:hypothetical protein|nr:hypothetical protein [Anaerolineae bacterium]